MTSFLGELKPRSQKRDLGHPILWGVDAGLSPFLVKVLRMAKEHICLVCWDAGLARAHAARLKADGFRVTVVDRAVQGWITYFRDLAVDAVAIDLDRLPSHGREVGIVLGGSKSTRHLPLVFLGGPTEKAERVRGELPDAGFAGWGDAVQAIRKTIGTPVKKPVRPPQMMGRSRDGDLARKLGIKPQLPVVLWGDADFLGELIGDATPVLRRSVKGQAQLFLCVTRSTFDVETAFDTVSATYAEGTLLWIVHPKQSSRLRADFNQNDVREIGLAHGWVDFKVCAVDADWSGLEFARRKTGEALKMRR
jgi:hypothetical protein